jgi:hypothetical protein
MTLTNTPGGPTNTPYILQALAFIDPFCTADSLMQWTIENPNPTGIVVHYWTLDGGSHNSGFTAASGSTTLTTSALGQHTVFVSYGESQSISLTWRIDSCAVRKTTPGASSTPTIVPSLSIPVTGGTLIIPVTGADDTGNIGRTLVFSGFTLLGLAFALSGLRKRFSL